MIDMNKLLFLITIILGTLIGGSAMADSPTNPTAAVNQAISPEDLAKLRLTLEQLSKNMNADSSALVAAPVTSSSAAPSSSADPPKKSSTVADVANKALDMMGNAVAAVASNLQKIAPHVWRIMIKQQYAKAAYEVAEPLMLFLGGLIFTIVMRRLWKPELILKGQVERSSHDWDNNDTAKLKYFFRSVVPSVYLVIMSIWLACGISSGVKYVINPEYYAVKDILTLVTNPTQAPE